MTNDSNNNNTTATKNMIVALNELSPVTLEKLFRALQEAKQELLDKYDLKQLVVDGDDDVAFIYDLNLHCFQNISKRFNTNKE